MMGMACLEASCAERAACAALAVCLKLHSITNPANGENRLTSAY